MASVKTTLVNNDVTKPLFDIAKGETPFIINSRIGYSGDTRSDLSLKPLNYENGDEKWPSAAGNSSLRLTKTVMRFR